MQAWILIVGLLVTGITSAALISENEVKRQANSLTVDLGPNNEVCLLHEGVVVVYLTGYNARMYDVMDGEMVEPLLPDVVIGDERLIISDIYRFKEKRLNNPDTDEIFGPGKLYVSDGPDGLGRAFFIDSLQPINQILATAPPPRVTVDVGRVMDGGNIVVQAVVNEGEFSKIVTDQPTKDIEAFESVSYSGGRLMAQGQSYSNIDMFSVTNRGPDGYLRNIVYNSSQQAFVRGPGQLFVGGTSALFIEESSLRSQVNRDIVMETLIFNDVPGEPLVMVTDIDGNAVTLLSSSTTTVKLADAVSVSFSASDMTATFIDRGGRVTRVPALRRFSVYDNNDVQIFATDGFTDLSSGGKLFSDPLEGTALFATYANPVTPDEVTENIPPQPERPIYDFETDRNGVRWLVARSPSSNVTERIQQITGAYVTPIPQSQTLTYMDGALWVSFFFGLIRFHLGLVFRYRADAGMASGNFNMSAPVPYRGPGTLSINRGVAFFTTDPELGRALAFEASNAPIPNINFEVVPGMPPFNEVDGINYTVSTVIQTVGNDRVITYEAGSYATISSQEILYSGDLVTVSRPRRAGSGMVEFNGGAQTVTYRDRNGNMRVIMNVNTFHEFSGGDVTTTTSGDSTTVQGPGKLYVSEDGMEVLFSNSNFITPEVAEIIRRGRIDFSVRADQFSYIINGMTGFFTESAIETVPGGGLILYSTFDGIRRAFYVENDHVLTLMRQAVSSALLLTKSPPPKDVGIIRLIFNGRPIFDYSVIRQGGINDIRIGRSESFFFNSTMSALIGDSLPDGLISGINMVVFFDGLTVKNVNSSMQFNGFGLLLVPPDSSTAFYTTLPSAVNYLLQSIANVRNFLVPPHVQPGTGSVTTKDREVTVDMGTDVTVYAGANVTFVCNVRRARPEADITFVRFLPNDTYIALNDSDRVSIENNTVTIYTDTTYSGEYGCGADNGVPPISIATSSLTVLEAVAPMLQPGWFPFFLKPGQKLISPSIPEIRETIDLREFKELIFACRVDGRPKAEVDWLYNDVDIGMSGLPPRSYAIKFEEIGGRSVLMFNLQDFFNETDLPNGLLGTNTIQCSADNEAGSSVTGTAVVTGEIIDCGGAFLSPTTQCSASCGYGIRRNTFDCSLTTNVGVSVVIDIDDVPVRVVPLIDRNRVCTARDVDDLIVCPITEYRWNVSEWTDCSRTCGGGSQTRTVTCLSETFSVNSLYVVEVDSVIVAVAEDMMCDMFEAAGERPAERQLCELDDCPFWQASQFGECSVTCGGGVRLREVNCVTTNGTFIDMNNKTQTIYIVLNETFCDAERKPRTMIEGCNSYPCVFRWSTGMYGPCGELSLDENVVDEFPYCRERPVVCFNEYNKVINDTYCDSRIRPTSLASCGGGRCFAGFWSALQFGDCSETCGYGVITRELQCFSPVTWIIVLSDFCDVSKKPVTTKECFVQNCEGTCLKDESSLCPIWASVRMCNMPIAMGCCISCMGMTVGD